MLTRALISLTAAALAFALFVASVGLALTRPDSLRTHLRNLLAQELARTLSCEVAVGPSSGDVWHGLTVHGLAIAGSGSLTGARFLSVPRLSASFDLWTALAGLRQAPAGFCRLEVDRPQLRLSRSASGQWQLLPSLVLRPRGRPATPGYSRFLFPPLTLLVRDGSVHYTDRALRSLEGAPLEVRVQAVSGRLRPAELLSARSRAPTDLDAKDPEAPVIRGSVEARCGSQQARGRVILAPQALCVTDVEITDAFSSERLRAQRIGLAYDLAAWLREPRGAARYLKGLELEGADAALIREATGELGILRQVRQWFPSSRSSAPPRFSLSLRNCRGLLEDRRMLGPGRALRLGVQNFAGTVDIGLLVDALHGRSSVPAGLLTGEIEGRTGALRLAGRVSTDLTTQAAVDDLQALENGQAILRAQRAALTYDLARLVGRGRPAPGPLFSSLAAEDLWADVTVDRHCRPAFLAGFLPPRVGPATPIKPGGPLVGRLQLNGANVTVRLQAVTGRSGRPLALRVEGASAEADLARQPTTLWGALRSLDGRLAADLDELRGQASVSVWNGRDVQVTDLRLVQSGSEVLAIPQGRVSFDWRSMARGPLGAIRSVSATGLRAQIVRAADGSFPALPRLADAPTGPAASRAWQQTQAWVQLRGADVAYVDRRRRAGVNAGRLTELDADVRLSSLLALLAGGPGHASARPAPQGTASAQLAVSGPELKLQARVRADLARWLRADGLRVVESRRGETVRVGSARLDFDGAALWAGRGAAALRSVSLLNGHAQLVRGADGQWSLGRAVFGPARPARRPDSASFPLPQVTLRGFSLNLTDRSFSGGPLLVWAEDLHGRADPLHPRRGKLYARVRVATPVVAASGRVVTDLASWAVARNLVAWEAAPRGAWRSFLRATLIATDHDLSRALRGGGLAALERVTAKGFALELGRGADGTLRPVGALRRHFSRGQDRTRPPARTVTGPEIVARDGTIVYRDATVPGGPLRVRMTRLTGRVPQGQLAALVAGEAPRGGIALQGRLTARWPGAQAAGNVSLSRAAVAGRHLLKVTRLVLGPTDGPPQLAARAAEAEVDLHDLLDRSTPAPRAVTRVSVRGLEATLTRDASGKVDLATLVRGLLPAPRQGAQRTPDPWSSLRGVLVAQDSSVRFRDVSAPGRAYELSLEGAACSLAAHGVWRMFRGMPTEGPGRAIRLGPLSGRLAFRAPGGQLSARLVSEEVASEARLTGVRMVSQDGQTCYLDARAAELRYDLGPLAQCKEPWTACLRQCRLERATASLVRGPDGRLDVAGFLGPRAAGPVVATAEPADRLWRALHANLQVRECVLRYADLSVNQAGAVKLVADDLTGIADLATVVRLARGERVSGAGTAGCQLRITVPEGEARAEAAWEDLAGRMYLRNVSVKDRRTGNCVAACETAAVRYDLSACLAGQAPWAAALQGLVLDQADIHVTRSEEGRVDATGLWAGFPSARANTTSAWPGWRDAVGSLRLARANVRYTDLALSREGPVRATLQQVEGLLSVRELLRLGSAPAGPVDLGRVRGTLSVRTPRAQLTARVRSDAVGREATLEMPTVGSADGGAPLITSRALILRYDLARMVLRREPALAALGTCDLIGPGVRMTRGEDDAVDLVRLLTDLGTPQSASRPSEATEDALRSLAAQVRVTDGTVWYEDRARRGSEPVRLEAHGVNGRVSLRPFLRPDDTADDGQPGTLRAAVRVHAPGLQVATRLWSEAIARRVRYADLRAWDPTEGRQYAYIARGMIGWDLPRILREPAVWLWSIQACELDQADVRLGRGPDGQWDIAGALGGALGYARGKQNGFDWGQVRARLACRDSHLEITDRWVNAEGPTVLDLSHITGWADLSHVARLREGASPADTGSLQALVALRWPYGELRTRVASGSLARRARLEETVLTDGAGKTLLAARTVDLGYSLGRALAHPASWLAALDGCSFHGTQVTLFRDRAGRLDLTGVLSGFGDRGAGPGETGVPWDGLQGRLRFTDAAVQYRDEALNQRGPVVITLDRATGALDLAQITRLGRSAQVGPLGGIRGDLRVLTTHARLSAAASATDVGRQVALRDVQLTDGSGQRGYATLRAADLRFRLGPMLAGETPWAAAVEACNLDSPRVDLVREADGRWDVMEALEGFNAPVEQGELSALESLGARVTVRGGQVRVLDRVARGGPVQVSVSGLAGRVIPAALVAAREGRWRPGVGRLSGQVQVSHPREVIKAALDWDLDGRLRVERLCASQPDNALPVLTADVATIRYDPRLALPRIPLGPPAADRLRAPALSALLSAVRDLDLGTVWLQARRLPDGSLEPMRTLAAYRPEGPRTAAEAEPTFLKGLRAPARVANLTLVYEDLFLFADKPTRVLVSGASGEVRCDRLAALHAGRGAGPVGALRGQVSATWGDARASAMVAADLSGRLELTSLGVSDQAGKRSLIRSPLASVEFDPRVVWGPQPNLRGIRRIQIQAPVALVELDEAGRWELLHGARLTPAQGERAATSVEDLVAQVSVTGGEVTVASRHQRVPLLRHIHGRSLSGEINLGALWQARRTGIVRRTGQAQGQVTLVAENAQVTGRVSTDLSRRLQVTGLQATTADPDGPRELVTAELVDVSGRLAEALTGSPPTEQLRSARVEGLRAHIRRDADGRLELARLLTAGPADHTATPRPRLAGVVELAPAAVRYQDRRIAQGAELVLVSEDLQGTFSLGAIQQALDGKPVRSAGRLTGHVRGSCGDSQIQATASWEVARALRLTGLRVVPHSSAHPITEAESLVAEYDLSQVLATANPLARIARLDARGVRAAVVRHADGTLEPLPDLRLVPAVHAEGQRPQTFGGVVRLTDADLQFTDHTVGSSGPLRVAADGLSGSVNVGAVQAMIADGTTRPVGSLRGRMTAQAGGMRARAVLEGPLGEHTRLREVEVVGSPGADGLAARRVDLEADLGPLLAGWGGLGEVRSVAFEGLQAQVSRGEDGTVGLVRQVREALGLRQRSPVEPDRGPRVRARVRVRGGDVWYRDAALLEQGPLAAEVHDLMADLNLAALLPWDGAGAGDYPGSAGSVRARVALEVLHERLEGSLAGDLDRWLTVRDLRANRMDRQERVATARALTLRGRLAQALWTPPGQTLPVTRADLVGLEATLRRDPTGRLTSPTVASLRVQRPSPALQPQQPPRHLETWVTARDVSLRLEDESLGADYGPLSLELSGVRGGAMLRTALSEEQLPQAPRATQGKLRGTIRAQTPHLAAQAHFETDAADTHVLRDLQAEDPDGVPLAAAQEARVRLSVSRLLEGREPTLPEALSGVDLRGASVCLGTTSQGELTVARLPVPGWRPPPRLFAGDAWLRGLNGTLTSDPDGQRRVRARVETAGSLAQGVTCELTHNSSDGWIDLHGEADRISLAALGDVLWDRNEVRVLGGHARASGTLYGKVGGEAGELAWTVSSDAVEGEAWVAALGDRPVSFSGPLQVCSDGLYTAGTQVTWGGLRASVVGSMYGLADPVLSARVHATTDVGETVLGLLPAQMRSRLRRLVLTGPLTARAEITGRAADPVAQVSLEVPQAQLVSVQPLGRVRVRDLRLNGFMLGPGAAGARMQVSAQQVSVARADEAAQAGMAVPKQDLVSSHGLGGEVLLRGQQALVVASAGTARIHGVPADQLRAVATVSARSAQVHSMRATVAGGAVHARGGVRFDGQGLTSGLGQLTARGINLARLRAEGVLDSGRKISGQAGGIVRGRYAAGRLSYRADAWVSQPMVDGLRLQAARAVLSGSAEGLRVELAQAAGAPGQAWMRGSLTWPAASKRGVQGDLELVAARVRPEALPGVPRGGRMEGRAYLTGRLWGDLADPNLSARVVVFDPGYGTYQGDVATADLLREGDAARVDQMTVARGAAVVGVTGLRVQAFTTGQGPQGQGVMDGRVGGGRLEGFAPARDLARAAGSNLDLEGWLRLNGSVRGTVRRPAVDCVVVGERLRVGEHYLEECRLPLLLAGETACVADGRLGPPGKGVQVSGRADDIYGTRRYTVTAWAPRLELEDLAPVRRLRSDVSGSASVPMLSFWGTRDSGPTGGGAFEIRNLRLGGQRLEPVSGQVGFGGGLVRLHVGGIRQRARSGRTGLETQPGQVGLTATYDQHQHLLDATIRLASSSGSDAPDARLAQDPASLPELGAVLSLAAPVAGLVETVMADREARRPAGQAAPAGVPASEHLRRLALRMGGHVVGRVRLAGPLDALSCQGELAAYNATLDRRPLPRLVQVSMAADLARGRLYDIEARAQEGDQYLEVTGRVDLPSRQGTADGARATGSPARVDLVVDGANIQLPMWRHWIPGSPALGGTATFGFETQGETAAPQVEGWVRVSDPSLAGQSFETLNIPVIKLREGELSIRSLRFTESGEDVRIPPLVGPAPPPSRRISLKGRLPWSWRRGGVPPDAPVDFEAEVDRAELGALPAIADEVARLRAGRDARPGRGPWSALVARGELSGRLRATGPRSSPALEGALTLSNGSIGKTSWQRPVEDLQVAAEISRVGGHNRVVVSHAQARWQSAIFRLAPGATALLDHLDLSELGRNKYEAEIGVSTDGPLDLGGQKVDSVTGGLVLASQTVPADEGQPVRYIHVLATRGPDGLQAAIGPGTVRLRGEIRVPGFGLQELRCGEYNVGAELDRALVRYKQWVRGQVSGQLRLRPRPAVADDPTAWPVQLDGTLTVNRARLLYSPTGQTVPSILRGLPPSFPSPALDVQVHTGEDVSVEGLLSPVPLVPMQVAAVTGTLQRPEVRGALVAREGAVRVPTGAMVVKRARLSYWLRPLHSESGQQPQGRPSTEPRGGLAGEGRTRLQLGGDLHLEAERLLTSATLPNLNLQNVLIQIVVDGQLPDQIQVRTWSQPPLSNEQVLALLGEEPLGGLTVSGRKVDDVLSEQALGLLAAGFRAAVFEPIEAELARALGLSELGITFGFNQSVDIRLGKYLLRDLLVTYQTRVGGAAEDRYKLGLSYRLQNRVRVAYTTNELGESRVNLTYDFGL